MSVRRHCDTRNSSGFMGVRSYRIKIVWLTSDVCHYYSFASFDLNVIRNARSTQVTCHLHVGLLKRRIVHFLSSTLVKYTTHVPLTTVQHLLTSGALYLPVCMLLAVQLPTVIIVLPFRSAFNWGLVRLNSNSRCTLADTAWYDHWCQSSRLYQASVTINTSGVSNLSCVYVVLLCRILWILHLRSLTSTDFSLLLSFWRKNNWTNNKQRYY